MRLSWLPVSPPSPPLPPPPTSRPHLPSSSPPSPTSFPPPFLLHDSWNPSLPRQPTFRYTPVDTAGKKYGIYSLIDHHQDAYSTAVCGTGFPSWTVANVSYGSPDIDLLESLVYKITDLIEGGGRGREFPAPLAESFAQQGFPIESTQLGGFGHPNTTLCTTWNNNDFPAFHFAFQTAKSYEEVYDDVHDKRQRFAKFWRHVAGRFKTSKHLLGYELMNEPFATDVTTTFLGGREGRTRSIIFEKDFVRGNISIFGYVGRWRRRSKKVDFTSIVLLTVPLSRAACANPTN